jgi:HK97 family phage portal protein
MRRWNATLPFPFFRSTGDTVEIKSDLSDNVEPWLEAAFSGGSVDALSVPPVQAAVRLIAEACATLDVNIEPDTTHPALTLLRGAVNDWTSGFEFRRDLVAQALTSDAGGIAYVVRGSDNKPLEILHYRTGRITVQLDPDTGEPDYRLNGNLLDRRNVIHLRGTFSKCPVTLTADAIAAAKTMERYAKFLFANGARPGGVIEMEKSLGDRALAKMKASWNAAFSGSANSGKTAILWDGAAYKQLALSSVDAQFLEMRRFQLEEIARAFGMSPSQLGDLTKSSYANASQKQLELIVYVIEPWLCALESAFDRALLTAEERQQGIRFKIDRDDLTRASLTERATAINSLRASEVLSADEGRSWLGLDKRTDGKGGDYSNPNITLKPAAVPTNG